MNVRDVPAPPPRYKDKGGAGSGFSHAKASKSTQDDQQAYFEPSVDPDFPQSLLDQIPETTIGMNVSVKGSLEFQNVLRINGKFEGILISEGDLIIGETGKVVGNINKMGALLVDGKLVGDINVRRVCLRGNAQVFGNITCRSLQMDPSVVVVGTLNVHPDAPRRIDSEGNEVKDEPPPQNKPSKSSASVDENKSNAKVPATGIPEGSKSEADAMKAKREAEAVKAKKEADAAKAKGEAEKKSRAAQKKKEEEDLAEAAAARAAAEEKLQQQEDDGLAEAHTAEDVEGEGDETGVMEAGGTDVDDAA